MRYVLTLTLALFASSFGIGQTTLPWQPDADGDGFIGAEDLIQFLTVYTTQWGPDLSVPCDYQGTSMETLFADLINGDATLDSMYFAYSIYDSALVFVPECPEQVMAYNAVERSGVIRSFDRLVLDDGRTVITSGEEIDGFFAFFDWRFDPDGGVYSLEFGDAAIVAEAAPFFGGLWHYANDHFGLPLPESWNLDELGLHFPAYESTLEQYGEFQFVPYWSTTED